MKIFNEKIAKEQEIDFSGTVEELFSKLNLNSEEFLVVKNGVLVTLDEDLLNSDELKLLSVISGG